MLFGVAEQKCMVPKSNRVQRESKKAPVVAYGELPEA
jgi:hypothetical protein